ncbi:MAG: cupin domain-containing protein [Proteobacteria bacterium]|nr:cupin domain-containing protein [Pseudomonadota bacterium]
MADSEVLQLDGLVAYQEGSIVSRTIIKNKAGSITLFAFDKAQEISEHKVPYDAIAHILDGEVEISVSGNAKRLRAGDMILMPANETHALKAVERFKMLLTMIREE